jgi:membrane protein YdbS with pleckstrin-like domain
MARTPQRVDPRKQFSKKLAARTEWFWFIYLILLIALVAYQPEVATSIVLLALIVTIVMIVSVLAYTENSRYEKGLYAAQQMAKIKFSWKHKGADPVTIEHVVEDDSDNSDEEGSNG